jgi:hypothetical protein
MALTKEEKTNVENAERRPAEKRPYRSPRLQRLGTVAELTLGNNGSVVDNHTSKMGS